MKRFITDFMTMLFAVLLAYAAGYYIAGKAICN